MGRYFPWCPRCQKRLGAESHTQAVAAIRAQGHATITGHVSEVWDVALGVPADRIAGEPALPLWE